MREMKLQDLKVKTPAELVSFAEELEVENASTMRKQELMFGILKQLSMRETDIVGEGVVEVLSDGFGFLRLPEANYLPGPDDIYVSPSQIRRFGLRTRDTIDGHTRSAQTTSPCPPPKPAVSGCAPATPSTATSARPRRANAISRCSRSIPSISK